MFYLLLFISIFSYKQSFQKCVNVDKQIVGQAVSVKSSPVMPALHMNVGLSSCCSTADPAPCECAWNSRGIQLKCLGPCWTPERSRWSSRFLSLAWLNPRHWAIWGMNQQTEDSISLPSLWFYLSNKNKPLIEKYVNEHIISEHT